MIHPRLLVLCFSICFCIRNAVSDHRGETVELTATELYEGMQTGLFDAVVDVRTLAEWNEGHIENASFVESLASYVAPASNMMMSSPTDVGTPLDLKGCEYCSIALYCRTGRRAGDAITILRENGFRGNLYNGLGVSQWNQSGFVLVNTTAVVPPCTVNSAVSDECEARFVHTSGAFLYSVWFCWAVLVVGLSFVNA